MIDPATGRPTPFLDEDKLEQYLTQGNHLQIRAEDIFQYDADGRLILGDDGKPQFRDDLPPEYEDMLRAVGAKMQEMHDLDPSFYQGMYIHADPIYRADGTLDLDQLTYIHRMKVDMFGTEQRMSICDGEITIDPTLFRGGYDGVFSYDKYKQA